MVSTHCAICGPKEQLIELYKATFTKNNIQAQTFSARRTPDRMHYRFVRCTNCGLIFSNPIFTASKITKLYKKSNITYQVESSYVKKTYGHYLKKTLKIKKNKTTRLLDIGCGNGFFLEEAREIGISSVYGIEPGIASVKEAPKWLQKNIRIEMFIKGLFKNNFFDIICCFHTLDHILDPNTFLQDVHAMLKKGGIALFIVHDTHGLSVKLLGEKSPIFDIEHIYLFNKMTLKKLFEKNNFKVIDVFPIKNNYPLNYWTRMLPLNRFLKKYLLKLLEATHVGNLPIELKAGNIGIIAQK